eukprot:6213570-Lingulodinium_polyedra.AAC.1
MTHAPPLAARGFATAACWPGVRAGLALDGAPGQAAGSAGEPRGSGARAFWQAPGAGSAVLPRPPLLRG